MPARPEVLALVLIRHPDEDRILASRGTGDDTFDRLFGGKVEHGELTHEAARRELQEELGLDTYVAVEPRQVLQSRFEFEGLSHHQIVFVHDAAFVDPAAYDRDPIERVDRPTSIGVWRSLRRPPNDVPLYPDGLDLSR